MSTILTRIVDVNALPNRMYFPWLAEVRRRRDALTAAGRRNEVLDRLHPIIFGAAEPSSQSRAVCQATYDAPWAAGLSNRVTDRVLALIVEASDEPPAPADPGAEAAAAEAAVRASVMPNVDGRGLSPAERTAVTGAVHAAVKAAGKPIGHGAVEVTPASREAGRVAGRAALARVLAARPRPEPEPAHATPPVPSGEDLGLVGVGIDPLLYLAPICGGAPDPDELPGGDVECDPAGWPDWCDADRWEPTDDEPDPDDRHYDFRARESLAADALCRGLLFPADVADALMATSVIGHDA